MLLFYASPEGLREVFTTGGLPPLVNGPEPVYKRTYGINPQVMSIIVGSLD